MRSDGSLDEETRAPRHWAGPALREWNRVENAGLAISLSGHERNHLFLNSLGKRFDDVSGLSGLDSPADGRGFVLFDYDRDGWQDIALVNTNAPFLELYRNRIGDVEGGNRAIALRFVGGNRSDGPSAEWSNRDGIGAQVTVSLGDARLLREQRAGEGFATQNSALMLIGIGARDGADLVAVRWPSGVVQEARDVPAGTLLTVYENPGETAERAAFARAAYERPVPAPPLQPTGGPERVHLVRDGGEGGGARPPFVLYTTMATWCPSCKRNIPQVKLVRDRFPAEQLAVVGVPIDAEDTPEMLRAYAAEYAPAYDLLFDPPRAEVERIQSMVMAEFERDVLPASVLTDREGRVVKLLPGVPTLSELRQLLDGQQNGASGS